MPKPSCALAYVSLKGCNIRGMPSIDNLDSFNEKEIEFAKGNSIVLIPYCDSFILLYKRAGAESPEIYSAGEDFKLESAEYLGPLPEEIDKGKVNKLVNDRSKFNLLGDQHKKALTLFACQPQFNKLDRNKLSLVARRVINDRKIFVLDLSNIHNDLRISHDWVRRQHVDKNLVVADITFEINSPRFRGRRLRVSFPIKIPGKNFYSYTDANADYLQEIPDGNVTRDIGARYRRAKNVFKPRDVCGQIPKFDNSPGDDQYVRHSEQALYVYLNTRAGLHALVNRLITDIISSQFAEHGDIIDVYSVILHMHSTKTPCGACEITTLEMQNSSAEDGDGFLKNLATELGNRNTVQTGSIPPSSIAFCVTGEGLQMFTSYTANSVDSHHKTAPNPDKVEVFSMSDPESSRRIFVGNFRGYFPGDFLDDQEPEISQRTVFSSASDTNATMRKARERVAHVKEDHEDMGLRDVKFVFVPAIIVLHRELEIPLEELERLSEDVISVIARDRIIDFIRRKIFNYEELVQLPLDCLQAITTDTLLTLVENHKLSFSGIVGLHERCEARLENIAKCALAIDYVLDKETIELERLISFSVDELEILQREEVLELLGNDLEHVYDHIEDVVNLSRSDSDALNAITNEDGISSAIIHQGVSLDQLVENYESYNREQIYLTYFVVNDREDGILNKLSDDIGLNISHIMSLYEEGGEKFDYFSAESVLDIVLKIAHEFGDNPADIFKKFSEIYDNQRWLFDSILSDEGEAVLRYGLDVVYERCLIEDRRNDAIDPVDPYEYSIRKLDEREGLSDSTDEGGDEQDDSEAGDDIEESQSGSYTDGERDGLESEESGSEAAEADEAAALQDTPVVTCRSALFQPSPGDHQGRAISPDSAATTADDAVGSSVSYGPGGPG